MTKDLKFLIDIVKKAAKLITPDLQVKAKGDHGDLVTNFDFEIEQFLIGKIKKKYPNFHIISEEFNNQEKMSENCFTIDPIDGTINFANGLSLWGIQIACVRDGETCAAVIFLPALKELYYADETGAYMNGKQIHVNNLKPEQVLYTAEKKFFFETENFSHRRELYSSAICFSWLACGKLGANVFSPKLFSWDITPGIFIAKQAGAVYFENKNCKIVANSHETVKYFEKLFD